MGKYNLNEKTLLFVNNFVTTIHDEKIYSTSELVEKFKKSDYYDKILDTYYDNAITKAIGWAITRSEYWIRIGRGLNKKSTEIIFEKTIKEKNNKDPLIESSLDKKNNVNVSQFNLPKLKIELCNYKENLANRPFRIELIKFLSTNLYESIMLKNKITDQGLRDYHLKKGMGEDLYFLTESFYRQKGLDTKKHSISDFITSNAEKIIREKQTKNNLIYEHMVPKNIYLKTISQAVQNDTLTYEIIYEFLYKYFYICTVAKIEEKILPSKTMGDNWDRINPFYRYEKVGIVFYPNPFNKSHLI